jgi:hypothetical protein
MRHPAVLAGLLVTLLLPAAGARAGARPTWGIEGGSPQRAAVALGLLLGDARGDGFDLGRNLFLVQVQPGLGGGRVSLGFAPFAAASSGLTFAGVAVKGSLLRTWGTPKSALPGRTYAGASLDVAWVVKGSLGVMKRVGGQGPRDTLVTWSVGLGL